MNRLHINPNSVVRVKITDKRRRHILLFDPWPYCQAFEQENDMVLCKSE